MPCRAAGGNDRRGVDRRNHQILTLDVLLLVLLRLAWRWRGWQMWVSASAATEDLFDTTIQPILDSYRPAGVSALGFKKVSLGTIPPKVKKPKITEH